MALTLDNRRQAIADTYAIVVDLIEELDADRPDICYTRAQLDALRSRLGTIDKDGPAPASTATTIVEAIESISQDNEGDETALVDLAQNAIERAVTVVSVDAIPGIYSYPARILTFADLSQCFVPREGQPASEPLYRLIERHELAGGSLPRVALPHVLDPAAALSPAAAERLREAQSHAYADNTGRVYGSQWTVWVGYAQKRGIPLLTPPASRIAAWLTHRSDVDKARPSTIQLGLQALKAVHRDFELPLAYADPKVLATMRGIKRKYGMAPDQVKGFSSGDLAAIEATAHRRRIGRWGKRETVESARRRGDVDIAITKCLFGLLLRRSELTDLVWGDLELVEDGTGTIHIKQSKVDKYGFGQDVFAPRDTVTALRRIRGDAADGDNIFDCDPRTITRRVQKAAAAAGLEGHYAGHSGRVGMAQTLAADGAEMPAIMGAGRWTSEGAVMGYTSRQMAVRPPAGTR